jgi:DNA-binding MarR family transcriptional regulator
MGPLMMTITLLNLSQEIGRISGIIAQLSEAELPGADEITPHLLRSMLQASRLRAEHISPGLFEDPAWNMLLELLLSKLEGTCVTISKLAVSGGVAPTTGLRWIERLEERGFVHRVKDQRDGRRVFVEISPDAEKRLRGYLTLVGMPHANSREPLQPRT